ncbi:MAG: precorrin-3B C(17)-methyltransferase [Syntrophobacteraceae bacterium]|nr:precorrin-3B C(17)-methyltransferase [Syntrophobacteraceae bacterium]
MSIGPGHERYLAPAAREALLRAEVVVGYKVYLDLVADLIRDKEQLSSGMRREIERCGAAIDHAVAGREVALVSSGDAGIYGMAGLVYDLCRQRGLRLAPREDSPGSGGAAVEPHEEGPADLTVEVIPGIPAFNAASSLVGAPLMHDFAAVSLSDHLTPWEVIAKRLAAAAEADFVLAIYNPRSKTRPHLLEEARRILSRHRSAETPVAIVRRAMRDGQWTHLTTLAGLPLEEVDMQSILIVGNSRTYVWDGRMVTPRGYLDKYGGGGE